MSDKWKRWRCYMDELEDLLRWMAEEIHGAERDAAATNELDTWPRQQIRKRPEELARRMRDMPFFGEILQANAGVDPADRKPAPDVGLRQHPTQVMDVHPMEVPGQALRPPHPACW